MIMVITTRMTVVAVVVVVSGSIGQIAPTAIWRY